MESPRLGQCGVDVEVSVAVEYVALTRFSGIRQPNRRTGVYAAIDGVRRVSAKDLRDARDKVLFHLHGGRHHPKALKLPVRRPTRLENRERQAAGPAAQAR